MGWSSCPLRACCHVQDQRRRRAATQRLRLSDAIRRAVRGNGWVTPAGSPPGERAVEAATAIGDIAHRGTNEPARQDALAQLPKWMEETR